MTFNYDTFKRDTLAALEGIGRCVTKGGSSRVLSTPQLRKFNGKNMMTDEVWQYRSLAGGSLIVEVSYSWFMQKPLLGLTVFCVGALAADAPEWDHSLSSCYGSVSELAGRMAVLEAGGRERIAALAAEA